MNFLSVDPPADVGRKALPGPPPAAPPRSVSQMPEPSPTSPDLPPCPACTGRLHPWFVKRTDRGNYDVCRCRSCRSGFVMPRPPLAQLAALYRDPATVPDPDGPTPTRAVGKPDGAQRMAAWLSRLDSGPRVLDVGAGDGHQAQALLAAGFAVDALEPSPAARARYRQRNGVEPFDGFLDAAFVATRAATYDAVLLSQVLEHLADPERAIALVRQLLRPGGIAVIAVPQFRSWLSILSGRRDMFISPPVHLSFFTRSGLAKLLRRHGLEEVHTDSVTWFDPARVAARTRPHALGPALVMALRVVFSIADAAGGGNTLEAYFRKTG
jgi:2-polyprenyl-3-methyl-5-hydroxy-6-metoxy-1,4-benzoquinol methylase